MLSHKPSSSLPELDDLNKIALRLALERGAAQTPAERLLLAVDATCGNGHDTLFLAETLSRVRPSGKVRLLSLDVQKEALAAARNRLGAVGLEEAVHWTRRGHEYLAELLPEEAELYAVMYNLGFLPGSDRVVVTRPETTLPSLRVVLDRLAPGGICSVHAYGGHTGGAAELQAVEEFFPGLLFDAFRVARYAFCNKDRNPEILFLAEKR